MSIPVELETDRLILRTMTVDDASQRYLDWLADERVNRYLESRFRTETLESLRTFLEVVTSDPTVAFAAIIEKPDRHIGNVKLGPIDPNHRRAGLGIMIGEPDCWGRGYAREVIEAMVKLAFEELGVAKVTAGAYASNIGSVEAFQRAGFVVEGVLRSHNQLGDTREDGIALGRARDDVTR